MSNRLVAVVGSRVLPASWSGAVSKVVSDLVGRGCRVGSGGAVGADLFALQAVVSIGRSACQGSRIFLPGGIDQAPRSCRALLVHFQQLGGEIVSGSAVPGCSRSDFISSLFARSRALVASGSGVVAFVSGRSAGTWFTCREAARRGQPVVVFPVSGPRSLQSLGCGSWAPLSCWPGAYRWVPSVAVGNRCRHGISVQCCAGV
ncbi:DNA-processing protein DprA [Desulfoferrobacter suflitae]|uniref:DNA-processing protein DprA n=1 Tax=Desulfoferrobacter suflitae TaxID=2865782 RepID=UPI00216499B1|nr:DNA-processing protein DprA [Desulfoferrobacter suflitae]MCK8600081.1 DNA-processing protein DprA [Desulfoferrobacter suflitae]